MKLKKTLAKWLLPDYIKTMEQKEREIDEFESLILDLHSERCELVRIAKEEKLDIVENIQNLKHDNSELTASINSLIKTAITGSISYKAIYNSIKECFDSDGFLLYSEAKKITGIDTCSYYPTEDNWGYFEDLNGFELITWLEHAAFGEISWIQLSAPYEKAIFGNLNTFSEKYVSYEKELYKKTIEALFSSLTA